MHPTNTGTTLSVGRRGFLRVGGLAALGAAAAACAPAVAPAPAAPGAPAAPAGAAKPAWEAEWDKLVEAAKKEGKVVIQTPAGAGYRPAIDAFAKAYPGIEPEAQAFPDSNAYIPKISGERKAGIYTFDVGTTTVTPMLQVFKPEGFLDPLRPALIRPDVLDDKVWTAGFEGRWADLTKSHVFYYQASAVRSVYINTDFVKEDEIKTLDDLLNPKWKGKIVTSDVTQGYVYTPAVLIRESKGEAFLRRLLIDQEPQIIRDRRQSIEALVRGRAAIGFGLHPVVLRDLVTELGAKNIKNPEVPGGSDFLQSEVAVLYNKAPHPNAARVFLHWLLSKEGQIAWSTNMKTNAARTDVPVIDQNTAAGRGSLDNPTKEEWLPKTGATQEFLKKLVQ